ncbi:MAG: ExbD/TolR family protein [Kiritimatiellia bacterium]|jgi:biopolymer transport protein ExbD
MDWFSRLPRESLRTRYQPRSRIYTLFFAVVPWINVALLVVAYVFFMRSASLVPGQPVELPTAPFHDGTRSSLVLVAKAIRTAPVPRATAPEDDGAVVEPIGLVVFFDDSEYDLSQVHRISTLRNAVAETMQRRGETEVLLYLDRATLHEDAMRLANLLRGAGATRVCCVARSR